MADERATYEIRLRDKFSQGFSKIDSRVNRFESRINRVNGRKGLGGFSSGLATAARWAGTLGLAIGAARLAKSIVTLGVNMEQTRVAFATMFGTVEEGNKVIDQLNEFANVTPFDNNKVIQSAKTLAAFGFQADELRPTLKLLGDVSAGTGKDLAEMAVIFGQIKSAGRLMGQDLLQLINAGFNPLQEISERTGKSVATLKDEMSKGLISFDMVKGAFASATSEGGKFFNLMEKQSKTLGGRFSTMVGKMQMVGITIGESLIEPLGMFVDATVEAVNWIDKLLNKQKALSAEYSAQFSKVKGLNETLNPLLEKYSKLQQAGDGEGLAEVAKQIGDIVPVAVSQWDKLGNAVQINTSKVQKYIENQENSLLRSNSNLIKSLRKDLSSVERDIKQTEFSLFEMKTSPGGLESFGDKLVGSALDALATNQAKADELRNKIQKLINQSSLVRQGVFNEDGTISTGEKTDVKTTTPKSVSSSISGSSPKNVTLNITKLVENINFTSQNWQQNKTQMVEEIKRALLVGLNDVVIANS